MADVLRLRLSSKVIEFLGTSTVTELQAGVGVTRVYACAVCDHRADATAEDTSVLVHTQPEELGEPEAGMVMFAHRRCSPSEIRPMQELLDNPAASQPLPSSVEVTVGAVRLHRGDHPVTYPVLRIERRGYIWLLNPTVDVHIAAYRHDGFVPVNRSTTDLPVLPGWTVEADGAGHLLRILEPCAQGPGRRVPSWVPDELVAMPGWWLAAARNQRMVLLIAGSPVSDEVGALAAFVERSTDALHA